MVVSKTIREVSKENAVTIEDLDFSSQAEVSGFKDVDLSAQGNDTMYAPEDMLLS